VDARWLQLAAVGSFIAYAVLQLGAAITLANALAFVLAALLAERIACALAPARAFDARSPLVTALSLTLLLRTDDVVVAAAAAAFAIAVKHLVRVRGKQVFNPSNIAIVAFTAGGTLAWVSPGTWGHAAMQVGLVACIGALVTARATRLDLALAFVGFWAAALFARALWLGDPLAIPLHQLCDGTLLVFAFFMITDPRATPDDRVARLVFAAALVLVAYLLRFHAWQPDALLWALALVSPLTPLLDRLRPAERFRWRASPGAVAAPPACAHS
jgi:Na+-transporting NADH:ubiquinone oxidoreductase subunit NqrB